MAKTIGVTLRMKDQFTAPARRATKNIKNMKRELKHTTNQVKRFGKQMKTTMKNVVKYTTMAGVAALGIFAKKSIDLASDLQEVQNVVDTTFGESSKAINSWSKTALKQYGLTTLQAKKYSSTLGTMMKSSGITGKELNSMSMDLAGLSGDIASFYNLKPDEAFQKLQSAVAGQTEPMRSLGVNMTVANMEAFALSKGIKKSWKAMTQAEQTTLRYQFIMEKTKDAQGDFQKTNKSWANQLRIAKATIAETGASIASVFLPALNKGLVKINDWISNLSAYIENNKDKFKEMAEKAKKALKPIIEIAKFIHDNWSTIAPIILTIVGAMTAYKIVTMAQTVYTKALTIAETIKTGVLATGAGVVNVMTIAQWAWNAAMNANPIGLIIGLIAGLVSIGILLAKNWDGIKNKAVQLWEGIKQAFAPIGEFFAGIWEGVKSIFKGFINFFIGGINLIIRAINKINFKVPDWIPFIGGKQIGFSIPEIPKFAKGGIATRPSIFGEAGAEMAIPLKKTKRSMNLLALTKKILGVESDDNKITINNTTNQIQNTISKTQQQKKEQPIIVNVYGNIYGEKDLVNKVGKAIFIKTKNQLANMA